MKETTPEGDKPDVAGADAEENVVPDSGEKSRIKKAIARRKKASPGLKRAKR